MSDEPVEFNGEEDNDADDDWGNRILCRDESCIGVIGPDGRCKECGLRYEPAQTEDAERTTEDAERTSDPNEERHDDEAVVDAPPTSDSDDDWENRTLCSDESCIGVIGPDGRCTECGKPYAD